jgi:hypothetical protein
LVSALCDVANRLEVGDVGGLVHVRDNGGMVATILDGKATAAEVKAELRARVDVLKAAGKSPGLGTVLVGDDPPLEFRGA